MSAQQFAERADAASFSVNLSPDGIASTLMCQFDPASSLGNVRHRHEKHR